MYSFSNKKIFLVLFVIVYFVSKPVNAYAIPVAEVGHSGFANWLTSGSTAVGAGASTVTATNVVIENVRQHVLRPIAWSIANTILQGITAQTVNWINSGFQGNPAYITNPDSFFLDLGDRIVTQQLSSKTINTGNGKKTSLLGALCTPFQPQIRLALVQQYMQQDQIRQCSLSQSVRNYDSFIKNFQNGGWEAWLSITQNNQNNPYGAYLDAKSSLDLQISNAQIKKQKQLDWGQGFLSKEKCIARSPVTTTGSPNATTETYDPETGELTGVTGGQTTTGGECTHTEIVTPGSVINDQLRKALGSGVDRLNMVNDINQIVGALMTQAIKGVVGGVAGGLRGLSQGNNGEKSLTSRLDPNSIDSQNELKQITSDIYDDLPSSLEDAISNNSGTTPLTPTINEDGIEENLEERTNRIQAEGNASASKIGVFTNETASASQITISGVQGYDSATDTYTRSDMANRGAYMIIYGSFAESGNTVSLDDVDLTVSYENSSQINIAIPITTTIGRKDLVVKNEKGVSDAYSVDILPLGVNASGIICTKTGCATGLGRPI